MTDFYTPLLDAGDRLADALDAGHFGLAAQALGDRAALLQAAEAADRPAPPAALVARFQAQDERLNKLLSSRLTEASAAVASAGRAAAAHEGYRPPPAPVLDTAPRVSAEKNRPGA